MPLCLPEKITSGPAAMGVMGAAPECIGANGVARAGGMTPGWKTAEIKMFQDDSGKMRSLADRSRQAGRGPLLTRCRRAHHGSNSAGRSHGSGESHLGLSTVPVQTAEFNV